MSFICTFCSKMYTVYSPNNSIESRFLNVKEIAINFKSATMTLELPFYTDGTIFVTINPLIYMGYDLIIENSMLTFNRLVNEQAFSVRVPRFFYMPMDQYSTVLVFNFMDSNGYLVQNQRLYLKIIDSYPLKPMNLVTFLVNYVSYSSISVKLTSDNPGEIHYLVDESKDLSVQDLNTIYADRIINALIEIDLSCTISVDNLINERDYTLYYFIFDERGISRVYNTFNFHTNRYPKFSLLKLAFNHTINDFNDTFILKFFDNLSLYSKIDKSKSIYI